MTKNTPSRKLIFWLIFFLFFTVVPFLLIEGAGRAYMHFKYGKSGKSYGLWKSDKELGAIFAENAYNSNAETNDYGFRNAEAVINPKPEGALRVIAYGGSTTFCYNLFNNEAWPALLEQHLRQSHNPKDQVLNGGVITWSIGHLYRRAKRDLPKLKPDYVLLYTGINEHQNYSFAAEEGKNLSENVAKGEYATVATNLDQAGWAKRNLVSMRFLDYVLYPFLEKKAAQNRDKIAEQMSGGTENVPTSPDSIILKNYQHVLRDFITLIREQGGKPVFIIEAHSKKKPVNYYLGSYSRVSASIAQEMGVPVLDGLDVVNAYNGDTAELFIASGAHFEKKGAELFASFLFENTFKPIIQPNNAVSILSK